MIPRTPDISIVLATHNRRDVVMETLAHLGQRLPDRYECEVIVVDNASTDGTAEAVRSRADRVISSPKNLGSCAKALGVDAARGRYIVFLDDDSWPHPGSLQQMAAHFEADETLGAAGFRVHLPDGTEECAALPDVFVGCGVGFRAEALRGVGGLDRTFFMQAEEYDLAFRLAVSGWNVRVFDDLHVDHVKTAQARRHERTTFFDVRNNLRVIARYLPDGARRIYRNDVLLRYAWSARRDGHMAAFRRGRRAGAWRGLIERMRFRACRLTPPVFERFHRWAEVEQNMASLKSSGVRRVVFVEWGKNVFAFYRAARRTGVEVAAIGDDRFAAPGRTYRGIRVLPVEEALAQRHDAVIVSNMAPVFADRAAERARNATRAPVYNWFGRSSAYVFHSTTPLATSDDTRMERPATVGSSEPAA